MLNLRALVVLFIIERNNSGFTFFLLKKQDFNVPTIMHNSSVDNEGASALGGALATNRALRVLDLNSMLPRWKKGIFYRNL